jgi:hypothetical protein
VNKPPSALPREFRLMLAAYKLQLGRRAQELGQASVGTWGRHQPISVKTEERLVEGEGDLRLPPFPFPGLRSFDPKEDKLFFGRDRSIDEVQKRLTNYGLVTVLGGSGSGKSSLVRAGLLPYLNSKRRIPGRVGSWYVAEFRPRMNPLCELADALVRQVMLPLLDIDAPGLAEAMGLAKDDRGEAAEHKLCQMMRLRFQSAQEKGGDAVRDSLLDFVDRELDEFDRLASQGVRVPGASLMLLLDQFEEVFRPEIAASQRSALLDLVVGLDTRIASRNVPDERLYKGGLFVAITMRSEELHRCAEHRGLSEVVNRSLYLLELLDPDNPEDAEDLHKTIVQPARNVLDDWGLAYDSTKPDAPFADGMPAWLLSGAGRRLPHQPDQLPLLQNALQSTWHMAMRRWSTIGAAAERLEIRREDLPGQGDTVPRIPDLAKCLCVRADKAAERARELFAERSGASIGQGEKVLQAAFRSLARRDDRGNWARRFADIGDIMAFLAADTAVAGAPEEAVESALGEFLIRGYLSGGRGAPYDISHEALIRNWPRFREWLSEPDSAARALERVVEEIDPRLGEKGRRRLVDWIPPAVSEQLAPVFGPAPTLPRSWALRHLEPMLERSALRERWQGIAPDADNKQLAQAVLRQIDGDRQYADGERRKETTRRRAQKVFLFGSLELVAIVMMGLVVLWFTLEKSISALYAAHAESLLRDAGSERGAQWPPGLRARVAMKAATYFNSASRLSHHWFGDQWIQDNLLSFIARTRIGTPPATMTNEELQGRARRDFDLTSRTILGRSFVITKSPDGSASRASPNCHVIGENLTDWHDLLPERSTDPQPWKRAFRVIDVAPQGTAQRSQRLQFGTEKKLAASDLQISLPSGAWLCLSPDATVIALSSTGQKYPDLYELQWTRCAMDSYCVKNSQSGWRVRYVPIPLAPGENVLPASFPCVTSVRHVTPGPADHEFAKVQVRYAAETSPACTGDLSSEIYVAEFFTGLAVPTAIQIPEPVKKLLTPCKGDDSSGHFVCSPESYIRWSIGESSGKFDETVNEADLKIEIERRPGEDILEVDVKDSNSVSFAADKISLPAHRINRAGITTSGKVLLYDEGADVTWQFVAKMSELEKILRERGNCSSGSSSLTEKQKKLLGELAHLNIDSTCSDVR